MAGPQEFSFLDLNYNSIKLSENNKVAIWVGLKNDKTIPIVYLNQPLKRQSVVHLDMEHSVGDNSSQDGLFTVGCTSCNIHKIQSAFYHTFSLCRKEFSCQGIVKQVAVSKKAVSVSLSISDDGRVLIRGIDNQSGESSSPLAAIRPKCDDSTFFIVFTGSAVRVRVREVAAPSPPVQPASNSSWIFSHDLVAQGHALSRLVTGKTHLAYMKSPMPTDSVVSFKITKVDKSKQGSFTFGLMKMNPMSASGCRLPEDVSQLHSPPWDESCLTCPNPLPGTSVGSIVTISRSWHGLSLQYNGPKILLFDSNKLGKTEWYLFIYFTGSIDQVEFTSPENNDSPKVVFKCSQCKKDNAEYLFLPCGHFGVCHTCNTQLKFNHCIACGTKVMTLIQLLPITGK